MHLMLCRAGQKTRRIKISGIFFRRHLFGYSYANNSAHGMWWDKDFIRNHYDLVYVMFDSFDQAALYGCRNNALFLVPKRGKWNETDPS